MAELMELLRMMKSKKYIVIILILGIGIALIAFIATMDILEKRLFLEIMNVIFDEWKSITFLLTLFIFTMILLKYSHNKAEEQNLEYLQRQKFEYKIESLNELEVTILKDGNKIKIDIKNINEKMIDDVKGILSLYIDKVRIKKIEFEFENLAPSYSERIFSETITDSEILRFDTSGIFIEEINVGGRKDRGVYKKGPTIISSNFYLLNLKKFIDYRLFGVRTKWNLTWLKNFFKRFLFPRIKWLYTKKKYGKESFIKRILSSIYRIVIFLLIYGAVITFMILIGFSIVRISVVIYEVLFLVVEIVKLKNQV